MGNFTCWNYSLDQKGGPGIPVFWSLMFFISNCMYPQHLVVLSLVTQPNSINFTVLICKNGTVLGHFLSRGDIMYVGTNNMVVRIKGLTGSGSYQSQW